MKFQNFETGKVTFRKELKERVVEGNRVLERMLKSITALIWSKSTNVKILDFWYVDCWEKFYDAVSGNWCKLQIQAFDGRFRFVTGGDYVDYRVDRVGVNQRIACQFKCFEFSIEVNAL